MLKNSENTTVFVPCPAGVVTGGAELLHQLVDVINCNKGNAYIVYYGQNEHVVPLDYQKYNIKLSDEIIDEENNILVNFEGYFKYAFQVKKIQIVLWWLSVDNYFLYNNHTISEIIYYNINFPVKDSIKRIFKECIYAILKPQESVSLHKLKKLNLVCNAYQSEYARKFFSNHGFDNLYPLKDYINDDNFLLNSNIEKEDIVIYNPQKGYSFTKKLIKEGSDIKFVPIQNLNRDGVISLMRKAKVYIDFGYHPGKDRLPREAVTNGCCIITGKHGSASYSDVDIPNQYKFEQTDAEVLHILEKIRILIKNYKEYSTDFDHYRSVTKLEKSEFLSDCKKLFNLQ